MPHPGPPAGPETPPPAEGLRPVPDAKARNLSATLYRELLKPLPDPKDRPAQKTLAQALLDKGLALSDRPVGTYSLLEEARTAASRGGDGAVAVKAVIALAERFAIDEPALLTRTLETLDRLTLDDSESGVLATACLEAAERVKRRDPDAALAFLAMAETRARKAKSLGMIGTARRRSDEVRAFKALVVRAKQFAEKLRTSPDDPEANLELGRFRCFGRLARDHREVAECKADLVSELRLQASLDTTVVPGAAGRTAKITELHDAHRCVGRPLSVGR